MQHVFLIHRDALEILENERQSTKQRRLFCWTTFITIGAAGKVKTPETYGRSQPAHTRVPTSRCTQNGLCELPIRASCPPGGLVLDSMCGSRTTCVAAKRPGHRWVGIDINPEYVSIAKQRLNCYEEH
jgi:site-specific DNA-methyltransferase (adenine-specific)